MFALLFIIAAAVAYYYFVTNYEKKEKYTLDDERFDTSAYEEKEAVVNHDLMEKLVLATNEEITRRTDDCSYIIETVAVKRFTREGGPDVYKCMFMCVRAKGFAYGFSVVSTLSVQGESVRVLSLRSQPMYAETPEDISPYVQDVAVEFLDYDLVKAKVAPTVGELEEAKEKLQ